MVCVSCRLHSKMRSVFKIEHHSEVKKRYKAEMDAKDKSLNFACPICGAQPQEKCELNSGTPRFESHRERRDTAKDVHRPEQRLQIQVAREQA
jgi:hypothetical protein